MVVKPKVPHMVFNIGDSVAEATNFCLEGHIRLLQDITLECGHVIYKYLVCLCEQGKEKKVPRIELKNLAKVSSMNYADREDKKTAGKRKLLGAKKSAAKRFCRGKVTLHKFTSCYMIIILCASLITIQRFSCYFRFTVNSCC